VVDNQAKLSICSFSGTHLVIMNSGFDNESTTKVNNNISNNSLKDKIMKKFVFAAIAAMVMVSDRIVLYFPEITNKQKAELPNPKFSLFACHQ
jgi:hypothetical protein